MSKDFSELLRSKMGETSYGKLASLDNAKLNEFIGFFAEHCNPATIYMCDDSEEDEAYVRTMSLKKGEERPLAKEG